MENNIEFPAIYLSTDKASTKFKKSFEWIYRVNLFLLITASLLGVIRFDSCIAGIFIKISGFIYFISMLITLFLLIYRFEKKWYYSRAFAESAKSLTWKFIIGGEPFFITKDIKEIRDTFNKNLLALFNEVKSKSIFSSIDLNTGRQITEGMLKIRSLTLKERLSFYIDERINEQFDWYSRNAKNNKKMSAIFFSIIIFLLFSSFAYLVFVDPMNMPIKVSPLIATIISSVLVWLQIKRHQELSEAYSLTALDISFIKERAENINDEESLSVFISDAETAFSREHTMWLARRDALDYSKIKKIE